MHNEKKQNYFHVFLLQIWTKGYQHKFILYRVVKLLC